jgi:hypothetical protein
VTELHDSRPPNVDTDDDEPPDPTPEAPEFGAEQPGVSLADSIGSSAAYADRGYQLLYTPNNPTIWGRLCAAHLREVADTLYDLHESLTAPRWCRGLRQFWRALGYVMFLVVAVTARVFWHGVPAVLVVGLVVVVGGGVVAIRVKTAYCNRIRRSLWQAAPPLPGEEDDRAWPDGTIGKVKQEIRFVLRNVAASTHAANHALTDVERRCLRLLQDAPKGPKPANVVAQVDTLVKIHRSLALLAAVDQMLRAKHDVL